MDGELPVLENTLLMRLSVEHSPPTPPVGTEFSLNVTMNQTVRAGAGQKRSGAWAPVLLIEFELSAISSENIVKPVLTAFASFRATYKAPDRSEKEWLEYVEGPGQRGLALQALAVLQPTFRDYLRLTGIPVDKLVFPALSSTPAVTSAATTNPPIAPTSQLRKSRAKKKA